MIRKDDKIMVRSDTKITKEEKCIKLLVGKPKENKSLGRIKRKF